MGAFDSVPFDSELAGTPSPIPNSKFADFDSSNLEALAGEENAPPPDGAASRGALGNPSTEGETPPEAGAIKEEPAQDMLTIFNQAPQEDRDEMTQKQVEALEPHGVSLYGGLENVLEKGGPQSWARAAQFGIDLTDIANKVNPPKGEGPEAALGQAMGNVPSDENAGNPAFKTKEQAVTDQRGKIVENEEEAAAKKKAQRDAIAAFLMETGLRVLASQREDLGGALGESAMGTMTAGAVRKRQASQDAMDAEDRKRRMTREDTDAESKRLQEESRIEQEAYDRSQRGAEEAKTARAGMQSVTNEEGEVYYFDPLDPEAGEWVEDAEGNRLKSADVGLSKAQIATNTRAWESKVNSKVEKIKAMADYDRKKMYPDLKGLEGKALTTKIIEIAQSEVNEQSGNASAEDDPLGLLQ